MVLNLYGLHFSTSSDYIASIFTLSYAAIMTVLPFMILFFIIKNFNKLKD
jgi:hypothetical protein